MVRCDVQVETATLPAGGNFVSLREIAGSAGMRYTGPAEFVEFVQQAALDLGRGPLQVEYAARWDGVAVVDIETATNMLGIVLAHAEQNDGTG